MSPPAPNRVRAVLLSGDPPRKENPFFVTLNGHTPLCSSYGHVWEANGAAPCPKGHPDCHALVLTCRFCGMEDGGLFTNPKHPCYGCVKEN